MELSVERESLSFRSAPQSHVLTVDKRRKRITNQLANLCENDWIKNVADNIFLIVFSIVL